MKAPRLRKYLVPVGRPATLEVMARNRKHAEELVENSSQGEIIWEDDSYMVWGKARRAKA